MTTCNPCTIFKTKTIEERLKVIGILTKPYGYKHYTPIPIGSNVYEDKRGYFMLHNLTSTGEQHRVYFYKDGEFKNHFE